MIEKEIIEEYVERTDWRINENSNTGYSFSGLSNHISGKVMANYLLDDVYKGEIAKAHKEGVFHIHDLGQGVIGYCTGFGLRDLIMEGLSGVRNKVDCSPPKHLDSLVHQIISFIGILSNEFAGAIAFSSVDVFLAPYVRKKRTELAGKYIDIIHEVNDHVEYEDVYNHEKVQKELERYVEQCMQQLIYGLNVSSRFALQTPFSNLSFDITPPADLAKEVALIGSELQDYSYGELQEEMNIINKAFLRVMEKGDAIGRVFTFPIPTYSITKDFDWDGEIAELIYEVTAKYGVPYFQNFNESGLEPSSIRSMCCRLQLDQRELLKRPGGMWNIGESTGSAGVVTLNINRLVLMSEGDEKKFYNYMDHYLELAVEALEIKRSMINDNLERGLMPYTKRFLKRGFDNHFSTVGIIGVNEACMNMFGKDIGEKMEFAKSLLNYLLMRLKHYQNKTGNLYNLEASPGEGASYRLARKDREYYSGAFLNQGKGEVYLSNSTALPVGYTDDLDIALNHQKELLPLYSGGSIFHTFLNTSPSPETVKEIIRKISNTAVPYFSITPSFSVCPEHGYFRGEKYKCPKCEKETEMYSRVVGFFRPIDQWNKGKMLEFDQRRTFRKITITP